jgi:hypothetical protein
MAVAANDTIAEFKRRGLARLAMKPRSKMSWLSQR